MKKLLFILFLIGIVKLHSQTLVVVKFVDEIGIPISNLGVYVHESKQSMMTDSNGVINLYLVMNEKYYLSLTDPNGLFSLVSIDAITDFIQVNLNSKSIRLNEVSIISNRWQSDKLISSNSLSLEELKNKSDVKDIPYLLQSLASVQVQSEAGNGIGYTGFRIRGIDPNQVQVNLNGIPLNDQESSRTYFVNTPDLIGNTDRIDILSGFVPGRAGTGGFGAAVDIYLNKVYAKPFAELKTQIGSFNTSLWSLNLHSGLMSGKYIVEARYSQQKSDGFIERSSSDLKALFLSGAIIKPKSSLRVNFIRGNERTGQAWFGLPFSFFNQDSLIKYNVAGREKIGEPYEDEVDQYMQNHVQLFYHYQLSSKSNLVVNANYTKGSGYYENYKSNAILSDYQLIHNDSARSDLVRRKWLDNDFYYFYLGIDQNLNSIFKYSYGLSGSHYNGNHFGKVSWVKLENTEGIGIDYYRNMGNKSEFAAFGKSALQINPKILFIIDIHGRGVNYQINGEDDQYGLLKYSRNFFLWNPKLALQFSPTSNLNLSASASYYEREPYREDVLANPEVNKEKLLDFEVGGIFRNSKLSVSANFYHLEYINYLALTGALNQTGDPLRVQIPSAHRTGIEMNVNWSPWRAIIFTGAGNLSNSRTGIFEEFLPHYGEPQNEMPPRKVNKHKLAFSPDWMVYSNMQIKIYEFVKKLPLTLNYAHKVVGIQYLDLSFSEEAKLPMYQFGILRISHQVNWKGIQFNSFIQCYNVWNEKYSTHGWLSRFTSDTSPEPDPYIGAGSNGSYFYKGLYPQALRHYSFGITVRI